MGIEMITGIGMSEVLAIIRLRQGQGLHRGDFSESSMVALDESYLPSSIQAHSTGKIPLRTKLINNNSKVSHSAEEQKGEKINSLEPESSR